MNILFDHCVPRRLRRLLANHVVRTSREMRWDGLRNGLLLDQAQAAGFDVPLTVDKGFRHQQNLGRRPIAVILMLVVKNRFAELAPLAPDVLALLPTVQPGRLYEVPLAATPFQAVP